MLPWKEAWIAHAMFTSVPKHSSISSSSSGGGGGGGGIAYQRPPAFARAYFRRRSLLGAVRARTPLAA